MNKKKACIESLAAVDDQEPPGKIPRNQNENPFSHPNNGNKNYNSSKCKPLLPDSTMHFINRSFFNDNTQADLAKAFRSSNEFINSDSEGQPEVTLGPKPFRHCVLSNFITKDTLTQDLETDLLALSMKDKNNDLYKFSQSRDLNCSKSSNVSTFRSLCQGILPFIADVTGIPLNSKIDLFCSQYKYTDTLLCHDDELEERRVAFIYYLVPRDWSAADGGALDLFDSDDKPQPLSVVKSIVPKRNSFLFFEVSSKSFHQVAEVLSEDKARLSISGWFHGPKLPRPPPMVETLPPAVSYGSIEEEIFYSWFNPLYLAPDVQSDIRKRFEEDSEIELTDFLQDEKYEALVAALKSPTIQWQLLGPANKRRYHQADETNLPPIVQEYLRVIHSDAVFLVLSNLTGLKLHPLAPMSDDEEEGGASGSGANESSTSNRDAPKNPKCRSELRKWQHGSYTLAHDTDMEAADFALDSMLFIDCGSDWSFGNGGYTSYIAKGEDEELLSVTPLGNSLALVYRDKGTTRFVKHLNHKVTQLEHKGFFEVNAVYTE